MPKFNKAVEIASHGKTDNHILKCYGTERKPDTLRASFGKGKKGAPQDPENFETLAEMADAIKKRAAVKLMDPTITAEEYTKAKDRGPWLMRAIDEAKAYNEETRGWHRRKGAVTECDWLMFDADKFPYGTAARVRARLKEEGIAFIMYATTGHGLEIKGGMMHGECFRLVIPCLTVAGEIAEAVSAAIRDELAGIFGGGVWDDATDQPTRLIYLPPINGKIWTQAGRTLDAAALFKGEALTLTKTTGAGLKRGEADAGPFSGFVDWCLANCDGAILIQKPDGRVALQMPGQQPDKYSGGEDGGDGWNFYLPSGDFSMLVFHSLHELTEPEKTFKIQDAVNVLARRYGSEPAHLYSEAVAYALSGESSVSDCSKPEEIQDQEVEAPTGVDWKGEHFGLITGSGARALMPNDFDALNEISNNYALVTVGGKVLVAFSQKGDFGDQVEFLRPLDFKARMGGCGTIYGWKKVKGKLVAANPIDTATAWLNWSRLRRYNDGVTFAPGEGDQGSRLNLWQGYAVRAKHGDVSVWLEHLERVICNGDKANARYLLQYLAHMVQRPQEKPSVSVTLRTEGKGAGKDLFLKPLLTMFGRHAILLNDTNQVTGRFNAVLEGKILITLNEARIHSEDQLQKFKTVISEPTAPIERKGVDIMNVRNFARLISTTNHDDAIKVEKGERRQFMLACSEEFAHREGDIEHDAVREAYFGPLAKFAQGKGPAYLLDYLQNVDLSGFNPHKAPATAELSHALALNMAPFDAWLVEVAQNPRVMKDDGFTDAVSAPNDKGEVKFLVDSVARHYIKRFQPFERKPITLKGAQTKIGLVLNKARIATHRDSLTDGGKSARYFWITPDRFREKIACYLGQPVESLFD